MGITELILGLEGMDGNDIKLNPGWRPIVNKGFEVTVKLVVWVEVFPALSLAVNFILC